MQKNGEHAVTTSTSPAKVPPVHIIFASFLGYIYRLWSPPYILFVCSLLLFCFFSPSFFPLHTACQLVLVMLLSKVCIVLCMLRGWAQGIYIYIYIYINTCIWLHAVYIREHILNRSIFLAAEQWRNSTIAGEPAARSPIPHPPSATALWLWVSTTPTGKHPPPQRKIQK